MSDSNHFQVALPTGHTFECAICFETLPLSLMCTVRPCNHFGLCLDCMWRLLSEVNVTIASYLQVFRNVPEIGLAYTPDSWESIESSSNDLNQNTDETGEWFDTMIDLSQQDEGAAEQTHETSNDAGASGSNDQNETDDWFEATIDEVHEETVAEAQSEEVPNDTMTLNGGDEEGGQATPEDFIHVILDTDIDLDQYVEDTTNVPTCPFCRTRIIRITYVLDKPEGKKRCTFSTVYGTFNVEQL